MILANQTFQYFSLKRFARLTSQFPRFQTYIASQQLVTIFRHKNKVVPNLKSRMAATMAAITMLDRTSCLSRVYPSLQRLTDKSNHLKNGGFNLAADS